MVTGSTRVGRMGSPEEPKSERHGRFTMKGIFAALQPALASATVGEESRSCNRRCRRRRRRRNRSRSRN